MSRAVRRSLAGVAEAQIWTMIALVAAAQFATFIELRRMGDRTTDRLGQMDYRMTAGFADLRKEMGGVRGEIGELRGEMNELRGDLRGEMGELRGELRALRSELKSDIAGLRRDLQDHLAIGH